MVFVLDGGPRAGQLVDDLPAGYRPLSDDGAQRAPVSLFEDVFADVAVWIGERAPIRPVDSDDDARPRGA